MGALLDEGDEALNGGDGGGWQDAMTEVEDVAGTASGAVKDVLGFGAHDVPGGKKDGGIEVALDGDAVGAAETRPGGIERGMPVEADDIATSGGHQFEDV